MCHVIIGGPVGNKYICDVIVATCGYRPSANVVAEKRRVHHLKLSRFVRSDCNASDVYLGGARFEYFE
jgi:hypothetical protein